MQTKLFRTAVVTVSISAGLLFSGQAFASSCKGLDNTDCAAQTSCSWVGGYERKDGRQVKAFCRSKPTFKAKAAATPAQSSAKPAAGK